MVTVAAGVDFTFTLTLLTAHRCLGVASKLVAAGVDLRGYLLWTLMDSFEWAEGTWAPRHEALLERQRVRLSHQTRAPINRRLGTPEGTREKRSRALGDSVLRMSVAVHERAAGPLVSSQRESRGRARPGDAATAVARRAYVREPSVGMHTR